MISPATFNHIQELLEQMYQEDQRLSQNPFDASSNRRWCSASFDILEIETLHGISIVDNNAYRDNYLHYLQ